MMENPSTDLARMRFPDAEIENEMMLGQVTFLRYSNTNPSFSYSRMAWAPDWRKYALSPFGEKKMLDGNSVKFSVKLPRIHCEQCSASESESRRFYTFFFLEIISSYCKSDPYFINNLDTKKQDNMLFIKNFLENNSDDWSWASCGIIEEVQLQLF